jgi:AraC-like DNA-binding protein
MWQIADIALRSAAVSLLLFLAGVFVFHHRGTWQGRCAAALALGIAAHLVCPFLAQEPRSGPLVYPVFVGCFGVPAFFLAFSRSVFDDAFSPGPSEALALVLVETAGFARLVLSAGDSIPVAATLSQLPALLIVVLALLQAWAGLASDLIEERRRLRRALVAGVGTYMVTVVAVEMALRGEPAPPALAVAHGALVLAVTVFVAARLLVLKVDVLWDRKRAPDRTPDLADQMLAERVTGAMTQQRRYHAEGLTIGMLAESLGEQEYRLRRVINGTLGFRNFNAFVNQYRVEEACERLADPTQARLPILTIALELGFGSLGPFNRAFRGLTGQTPSDYRKSRLRDPPAQNTKTSR